MSNESSGSGAGAGHTALRRMRTVAHCAGVAALLILGIVQPAGAVTQFFTDKTTWLAELASATDFALDADNVALANEVVLPPVDNELFGTSLTFDANDTGLPFGFTFAVDTAEVGVAGNTIIYIENAVGNGLGVATNSSEHDWIVSLSSPVFALGMTVRGRGSFDDGVAFLDGLGNSLAGFASPPNPAFVGIISETPISQFLYEDSNVSGGRVLIEISAGTLAAVPEPGTLAIVGLGLVGLGAARRRRRRG